MRRLLLILSIGIMIGSAVPAHSDPDGNDAAFLSSLQKAGITYPNPDQAVAAGRSVCDLVSNGKPAPDVVQALRDANPGFKLDSATRFVGIAANAYCPAQLVTGADDRPPRPKIDLDK